MALKPPKKETLRKLTPTLSEEPDPGCSGVTPPCPNCVSFWSCKP